ncbi:alpha/beta fold hydrolase [Streptomyces indicus]|uniref:Pimeloyl-ACP methyl ester carboxylesterase n=1 Tax=Streptomyces indicus TaxID=417292 RepID=A0A1G9HBU0_9ACTN|nr:alpha/beta hydrolase [Streptomyces indicus]SDL10498.1 Pimeloyl-ACP methyl ester carboxylesterase [Streptomyces indicus]
MTGSTRSPFTRSSLDLGGRRLSYLDTGGAGRPLLALHGHLAEGASFTALALALGSEWRVIAPDQRGHGDSDRAADYGRNGYVDDLVALLEHLAPGPVVALGHSLGGINAMYLAARRPDLVAALVDVDGPVVMPEGPSPLSFVLGYPYTAATREELIEATGPVGRMIGRGIRQQPDGSWRLPFHPQDTVDSENAVHGSHWDAWLGSSVPALLVNGRKSQALPGETAEEMAARRPHTTLVRLDTDHFVQAQDPEGFHRAVREFLAGL